MVAEKLVFVKKYDEGLPFFQKGVSINFVMKKTQSHRILLSTEAEASGAICAASGLPGLDLLLLLSHP
jgi:hypothetical protein